MTLRKNRFFIVFLLLGLGTMYCLQAQSTTKENGLNGFLSNEGYIELKMQKLPSGHLHIAGVLNGNDANFILDTGASGTVIDAKRKEKFQMESKATDRQAAGAGGSTMQMQVSNDNELRLGDLNMQDMDLMMINLDHVNMAFERLGIEPVDGVIGADVLTDYEAIIDYVNLTLYVKN